MLASNVSEIMTREVVTLVEEDNLVAVAQDLARYRFRHLPVVDGSRVVGMVSQRDMLENTVAGVDQAAFARSREARFRERTFVRDIMNTKPLTTSPDAPIAEAARKMLEAKVGALPVTNATGDLVGIVSESDVLRFVVNSEHAAS
jgi:CBS domain-containing protein